MVYIEGTGDRSNTNDLSWKVNIPFNWVSQKMIEMIKDRSYTYDSYLKWSNIMDNLPTVWNIGLVDGDNKVYMFAYGTFNPLDNELEIKRAVIQKELFSVKGKALIEGLDEIKEYAKSLGIEKVYWMSKKWKGYVRKMSREVEVSDIRILEVL